MAYIKYPTLGYVWHSLSTSQKNSIYIDLVQHTSSLRELLPPIEGVVSSAFQNPAYDSRIGSSYLGPLNHEDFHSVVRGQMPLGRTAELVGQEAVGLHTNHYRTCFTHGNLTPRNIMVKNGHVVAIIDWESAGWFPEYWEYTKAHYTALGNGDEELIQLALTNYFLELEAEKILWTKLPEQGTPGLVSRSGLLFMHQGSAPSKAWLEARKTYPKKDLWAVALARHQD
ncbi:hypothetical protein E4U30_000013 [Claviceps sp. LM220 group G6]|nr:hypothetical protein E4U30_000013 [Claviceps sp. LM220 group G6]